MKKLIAILAAVGALFTASAAAASTCSSNPYTLTDGQTADATQVMADFNNLLNCLNLNVLPVASPTFTGTITGANLSLSGTATIAGGVTSSLIGNASTASQWQTARTETLSGDVNGSASVNGAGGWTVNTTLANSGVGAGTYGNGVGTAYPVVQFDSKGRAISASTQSIALPSAAQILGIIGQSSANCCSPGTVTIPTSNVGNFYLQWGVYDCGSATCWNSNAAVNVTYATACPTGALAAVATPINPNNVANARYPTLGWPLGASGMTVYGEGASDEGFNYLVICR